MKDDIMYDFGLALSETSAKPRQCDRESRKNELPKQLLANHAVPQKRPAAPDAASHLDPPPKDPPPLATFSELLFEQSERPPHVMPTGLTIALLAVSMLESAPPANVSEVLADIRHNLDRADAELRSVSVTIYSIKHWLQLEMARERVAVFELCQFGRGEEGYQPE